MLRLLAVTAAAVTLAACSTTVKEAPAPGGMTASAPMNVTVRNVTGSVTAAKAPQNAVFQLSQAIRDQLAKSPGSGPPADLTFVITDYRLVGNAARAMVGVFGGSNRITVDVTLRSPSGAVLRQFQVSRSANTMGVGAFMDQEASLFKQAAEGVAKTVRGEK